MPETERRAGQSAGRSTRDPHVPASRPSALDAAPSAPRRPTRADQAIHRLAWAAAVLTWPLLLVGGSVTVYRVGMAVPDWPTTFGVNMFLYDFLNSSWGVFLEHSHRLYAAGLGVCCIALVVLATLKSGCATWPTFLAVILVPVLAVIASTNANRFLIGTGALALTALAAALWYGLAEREGRLALVWFILAAVVGQGLLGGYRVRWNSTALAFVHGITAQAFFALIVALVVVTGTRSARVEATPRQAAVLRSESLGVVGLMGAQIALGAWLRHFGDGRWVIAHAVAAVAAAGVLLDFTLKARRRPGPLAPLIPATRAAFTLVLVQLALGAVAWLALRPFDGIPREVWPGQALVRIAHQGTGALLLAATVTLALRVFQGTARAVSAPTRLEGAMA